MPSPDVTRRIDGKAEYLGIVRVQPPYTRLPEQKVQVDLGGVKHVYDVRSGQYMGTRDKMELSLPGSATYLYAMLPYAVTGMQAQVDKAQYACGETIMEVVRPDGQTVPYLSSNVIATDGTARFTVPLCLNEPPGKWTLTFTDAATQIKRSVSVQVDGIAAQ